MSRDVALKRVYSKYKSRALQRSISFNVSSEYFILVAKQNCYICGARPNNKQSYKGKKYLYSGVDRINNSVGYIDGNIAPCCKSCNSKKTDESLEAFFLHIVKILKYSASLVPLRQQLFKLESD